MNSADRGTELRKLIQLTFRASEEARPILSDHLLGLGSEGVAEDIREDGMYDLSAYFPMDGNLRTVMKNLKEYFSFLRENFPGMEIGEIKTRQIHSSSWMVWRELLKKVRAGKRVVIIPPWEEYVPEENEIVIEINPSLAFGTGHHESTRLSIASMEEIVEHAVRCRGRGVGSMLDVGCGSGILAICAVKLGVPNVTGFDLDPVAVRESLKNARKNSVGDEIRFFCGLIESVSGSYDLIVANVHVEPILLMKEAFSARLAPGGSLVVSGIPISRGSEAVDGLRGAGFKLHKERTEGDWVSFELKKQEG